jgi:glycosyltransferase involved in cell wall biosynthesis
MPNPHGGTWLHDAASDNAHQCALYSSHDTLLVREREAGGDEVSYGRPPTPEGNWRDALLAEVPIDLERVHFLGKLPYGQYRRLLQVSAAHVYLTYPFVLSWSLLEALASGCAVVASDTAPVREVIRHGHNGLLVDFFSPSHISQTVLQVLAATDQMRPMRQAAMASVRERYEQTAATQRYLDWMGIGAAAATISIE